MIKEQKWKTGSEREGNRHKSKGSSHGRKQEIKEGQTRSVETVVFVPSIENSQLRDKLQKADDQMTRTLNTPVVKFVERGGTMIIEDLGRTNPWSLDWFCPRKEFSPCNRRMFLANKFEKEAIARVVNKEGGNSRIN